MDRGTAYIAMEYVAGPDLRAWLREAPRGRAAILDAFRQAGQGLAAAHASGLVHRDFKPDNVLVGPDGRVQVSDFGVARVIDDGVVDVEESEATPAPPRAGHTEAGRAGTPRYMAPEQLVGAEVDARSDQFAFCVALYEALTGEAPFGEPSATRSALVAAVERGPRRHPSLPRWLWRPLAKGLSLAPAHRHPSMEALLDALEPPRRSLRLAVVATVVSGLGIGLAATAPSRPEAARSFPVPRVTPPPSAPVPTSFGPRPIAEGGLDDGTWLPAFTVSHRAESAGRSWVDAEATCRAASLALCSEAQWRRACELQPDVAAFPSWTLSPAGDGFAVRGGAEGGCEARAVAPAASAAPGRAGLCCSRAVAIRAGSASETMSRITSASLLRLEGALAGRNLSLLESMTEERVLLLGEAMSKDRFIALFQQNAARDGWLAHAICEVHQLFREGEKAWTADCNSLLRRGDGLVHLERRYGFGGPHGKLTDLDETIFRVAE
ncbi:MAG: serine/threonine-protein kinase [Polyangiaceae bacterium]